MTAAVPRLPSPKPYAVHPAHHPGGPHMNAAEHFVRAEALLESCQTRGIPEDVDDRGRRVAPYDDNDACRNALLAAQVHVGLATALLLEQGARPHAVSLGSTPTGGAEGPHLHFAAPGRHRAGAGCCRNGGES